MVTALGYRPHLTPNQSWDATDVILSTTTTPTYSDATQVTIDNASSEVAHILVHDVNQHKHDTDFDIRKKYPEASPERWDNWLDSYNGLLSTFEETFCHGIWGKDVAEIGVGYGKALKELCHKYEAIWHGVWLDTVAHDQHTLFEKQDINHWLPLSRRHFDMELIYSFRTLFYSPCAPDLLAQTYAMLAPGGRACLHLGYRGMRDKRLLKQIKDANPGLHMSVIPGTPLEYTYPSVDENGVTVQKTAHLYPEFLQLYKYEGAPLYMDIPPYEAILGIVYPWGRQAINNSELRYGYASVENKEGK